MIRTYRTTLNLYDTKEDRLTGPMISLLRSMPGVGLAWCGGERTFSIHRKDDAEWLDVEAGISILFGDAVRRNTGWTAYSDLSESERSHVLAAIVKAACAG